MRLPFSPLWVTILIPGVRNGENYVFCGSPDSRLDFGTKSDEFLRCLGWVKPWFGVGGVSKSQFQWNMDFLDLGLHFNGPGVRVDPYGSALCPPRGTHGGYVEQP